MTAAQKRNREINRRIETTDRWLRTFFCSTALLLAIFAALTYIQVLKVNANLEQQIQDGRRNTEQAIKSIEDENKRAHEKQNAFLRCVLLIPHDRRTGDSIDQCDSVSHSGGMTSATQPYTTPPAQEQSVRNPTQSPNPPETVKPVAPQPQTTSIPPEPTSGLFTITDKVLQLTQDIKGETNGNSNTMVLRSPW